MGTVRSAGTLGIQPRVGCRHTTPCRMTGYNLVEDDFTQWDRPSSRGPFEGDDVARVPRGERHLRPLLRLLPLVHLFRARAFLSSAGINALKKINNEQK